MEQSKKILLTAFRGTSSESLIQNTKDHRILLLPNDKVRDSQLLIERIAKEKFEYVISIGQRPNIKDKVHIETLAREGEVQISTAFDCERLRQLFEEYGMAAKLSYNAGASFCNRLYWNGLNYISEQQMETQMVFVHVPFEKNITNGDCFGERFFKVISNLRDRDWE